MNWGRTHTGVMIAVGVAAITVISVRTADAQSICGQWNIVSTPDPETGGGALLGAEAVSANDAYALRTGVGPFLLHWDGGSWSEVVLPDLSVEGPFSPRAIGVVAGQLWVSSVVSTGPFSSVQLLLRWNGSDWDLEETLELQPNLAGAPRGGAPRAIDGAAADNIWIVGSASGTGDGVSGSPVLTVLWDGSELIEYMTPGLGARQNHLYGMVSVGPDDVWAVGYFNNVLPNAAFHAMILHWDGSSWSPSPNPAETLDQTFLFDVDALSPDDVWAVGENFSEPLFMHFDGTAWSIVPGPAVPVTVRMYKVAAVAPDDVWAVSQTSDVGFFHWDGSNWSAVEFPEVPGAVNTALHGALEAVGECDVWAAGSRSDGTTVFPLAARLQVNGAPSGIARDLPELPTLRLHQNVPNPFDGATHIGFDLLFTTDVVVEVFDVTGRRTHVERRASLPAGTNTVELGGRSLPAGVYYYRVTAAGTSQTKKMVIIR